MQKRKPAPRAKSAKIKNSGLRQKPVILIIDNDLAWHKRFKTLLGPRFEIKGHFRATKAAEVASQINPRPKLIILDTFFDDGDGENVFEQIRNQQNLWDVPVLMLSNFQPANLVQEANKAWEGQLRFHAVKPVTPAGMKGLLKVIRASM